MTDPGHGGMTGDERPLAETVGALSKEVRDLRASARLRAVIEQAKGVLVERHGISLDEAFARLRTMSQEHNVRLVEVAATVVGVAIPDADEVMAAEKLLNQELPLSKATSGTWRALREQPEIKAGVVTAIMDSLASVVRQGDEVAQLLLDMLHDHQPAGLTIYRPGLDGSLQLVGQVGVPGDLVSSWRRIPPSTDIPYIRTMLHNQAYFYSTREERIKEFPSTASARSAFEATATVPVLDGGQVVGVVGLMWTDSPAFDEVRRKAITRAVQRVTPLLLRNVAATDPELDWLNTLLRLHLDPWLLMEAVVSTDGQVRDFVVQDASSAIDAQGWIGRRFLEIWPGLVGTPVFASLRTLVQTGGVWLTTVGQEASAPWGVVGTQLRAVRLGQRVAMVWRSPEPVTRTNSTVALPTG